MEVKTEGTSHLLKQWGSDCSCYFKRSQLCKRIRVHFEHSHCDSCSSCCTTSLKRNSLFDNSTDLKKVLWKSLFLLDQHNFRLNSVSIQSILATAATANFKNLRRKQQKPAHISCFIQVYQKANSIVQPDFFLPHLLCFPFSSSTFYLKQTHNCDLHLTTKQLRKWKICYFSRKKVNSQSYHKSLVLYTEHINNAYNSGKEISIFSKFKRHLKFHIKICPIK